jgi:hypothetical protein
MPSRGEFRPRRFDLISPPFVPHGNTVDPGLFVSHLYDLNPMRPQKLLRPGELLYFVKDPDD